MRFFFRKTHNANIIQHQGSVCQLFEINFPQRLHIKKHISAPAPATIAQENIVALQPNAVATAAMPNPDKALPTYVHEFKSPDINDTFPYFSNLAGIIHISTRLTACIQPVTNAESATETAAPLL